MDFFENENADIFCIQESKMQKEQGKFSFNGYYDFWNSAIKKGYSGTVTLSKTEPISVSYGLGISHHDQEGRIITTEHDDFYLVNVYTPNSQNELKRLSYRQEWEDAFRDFIKGLEKHKPVIVCGDLNVAHKEIDLANPSTNRKNPGFTDEEREKITELLNAGFIDSYRYFYPDKTAAYTWWSYKTMARERNVGWRIDYFLLSKSLEARLKAASIYAEILGSDHCPVGIELT